jgi:hypothetical protein
VVDDLPLDRSLEQRGLALERAALALSGSDCRLSQQEIIETLERLEGVTRVEAETIPDHLLVDHDGLHRTGEELAGFVNGLAPLQGRCRAAVMQSCITAAGSGGARVVPER